MIIRTVCASPRGGDGQTRKIVISAAQQGLMFTTYHDSLERANVTVGANGNTEDITAFQNSHIPAESFQEG